MRQSHVRRAQLYYLRGRRGKAARLRAKRYMRAETETAAPADVAPVEPAETPAAQ